LLYEISYNFQSVYNGEKRLKFDRVITKFPGSFLRRYVYHENETRLSVQYLCILKCFIMQGSALFTVEKVQGVFKT